MARYSFLWVTLILFAGSLVGHWLFGWLAFADEQAAHHQAVEVGPYLNLMARDTFENWQSEFLQLAWQVGGLALLYYAGSPQSRGDDERMEGKLDALLRRVDPEQADEIIRALDERYPGR
ncbi:hypothetical protein P7B02_03740 [Caulobacter segnis]|uniref:DUF6766 family protein n=1 Tax=Caulobacter segnis TaxID=88688 RepID=UPI00240F9D4D|nr:DUF6766 family protein [Caulobacter segnis]MDG2520644.1 hypothetical protein [Caulobacter segnis]